MDEHAAEIIHKREGWTITRCACGWESDTWANEANAWRVHAYHREHARNA